jgi:hypothetical protein
LGCKGRGETKGFLSSERLRKVSWKNVGKGEKLKNRRISEIILWGKKF